MVDQREKIQLILKDIRSLPTLPGVIKRLSSLAESDKSTIEEIARVVSSDQILSAKVLKLVNSPFYGFSGRISTVSNALILLGVDVVKSLVLSSSIFEIMEKSIVGLWEHSLGSAVAGSCISKRLKLPDAEEISTAALLHDIGKVIIKIKLDGEFGDVLSLAEKNKINLYEAERELMGIDHAEIGGRLAKNWHLPEKLVQPIACHHDVEKASTYQTQTAVVHLADVMIKASGFGFSGDDLVPQVQAVAWKKLGLTETILEEIIEDVEERLVEVKNFSLEVQGSDASED